MRGKRLTREVALEVLTASGPQKVVAHRYGISQGHVSRIRRGLVGPLIYRVNKAHRLGGTLTTLAFTGAA